MPSISSPSAVYMLTIPNLYTVPQILQGWAADDAFMTDPLEAAEILMGVDGILSAGFVHVPIRQEITLQADSLSIVVFDNWWQAQQQLQDIYWASAVIKLPALQMKYTFSQGALTTYPPLPAVQRTLRPRKFGITWQTVVAAVDATPLTPGVAGITP